MMKEWSSRPSGIMRRCFRRRRSPSTEAKELIGGYWIIQVKSKEEAVEWTKRCPANAGEMIEVRRIFEMSDFNIDPDSGKNGQVERV